MSPSILYRAVPVKTAPLRFLKHVARRSTVHVGIDIGKNKLYVVIRWTAPRAKHSAYEQPWFVENPNELSELTKKLQKIAKQNPTVIGIESTGSYGDPLRQALADAGLSVFQVRTKVTHDYAEVFDGVPSQHDGKDASVIAELLAQGKAKEWNFHEPTEEENEMKYIVTKLTDSHKDILRLQGKLEGLLARHWPEITKILPLTSLTLLKLLQQYGGPRQIRADREASATIRRFSFARIDAERTDQILDCVKSTNGVRQMTWDCRYVMDIATRMLDIHKETNRYKKRLTELIGMSCVELQRLSKLLGVSTAAVVWCNIGSPHYYHCADAWLKAMGLNLVEKSSGEYQSNVCISKRGNSETRRWLYLSAWRWVQGSPVKQWYQRKKEQTGKKIRGTENKRTSGKALIAVMRKMMKGIWHALVHGHAFEMEKLFCEGSSKKKDARPGVKRFRKRRKNKSVPKTSTSTVKKR
jgi:transposase